MSYGAVIRSASRMFFDGGKEYHRVSDFIPEKENMRLIRIPLEYWLQANEELLKIGRVSRSTLQPIYRVSDKQIEHLRDKRIPFKEVSPETFRQVWDEERALTLDEREKRGQDLVRQAIHFHAEGKDASM